MNQSGGNHHHKSKHKTIRGTKNQSLKYYNDF